MLGVPPSDLDLNFFSDLTKDFSLCLDHIASDLQLLVQGLDLHLRSTKFDYTKIPLSFLLIQCTMRMRLQFWHEA